MTRGEYWHGRKEPQIKWMVERMRTLVSEGVRHVVDIGKKNKKEFMRVVLLFCIAYATIISYIYAAVTCKARSINLF